MNYSKLWHLEQGEAGTSYFKWCMNIQKEKLWEACGDGYKLTRGRLGYALTYVASCGNEV